MDKRHGQAFLEEETNAANKQRHSKSLMIREMHSFN